MFEVVIDWMANQWMEFASLLTAIAAVLYAALAHNLSRKAAVAVQVSHLANLRTEVRLSLAEAHRSFISLRSSCQSSRAEWEKHKIKHMPFLGGGWPAPEYSNIAQVERDGHVLLQRIDKDLASVDKMNASELEKGFQDAKSAALEIERLAGRLERPPTYFS